MLKKVIYDISFKTRFVILVKEDLVKIVDFLAFVKKNNLKSCFRKVELKSDLKRIDFFKELDL